MSTLACEGTVNGAAMASLPDHVPPEAVVDFDVYSPPGLEADFHEAWRSLQTPNAPRLVWTPRNGGHWLLTRGEDIANVLADHTRFSNRVMQVPRERNIGNRPIPGSMDPPEQTAFRSLLNIPLSAKMVQGLEHDIRLRARTLVEKIAPQGRCEYVSEFARALPLHIFVTYAGLPEEDLPHLRKLAEEKVRPSGVMTPAEVMTALADYLLPQFERRRRNPGSDLLSQLLSGTVFGRSMTEDEALRLCSQVLVAGLDTVASMLSFTTLYLSRDAGLRRRLREEPSRIGSAVEEFLRRFPLVAIGREVLSDFVMHDVQLRAGDIVIVPTMLHGLDDRSFVRAMDINLDRPRAVNSTFGQGAHRCPGSFLARAELRIGLEEWLPRIPDFAVPEGEYPTFASGVVGTVRHLPLEWA